MPVSKRAHTSILSVVSRTALREVGHTLHIRLPLVVATRVNVIGQYGGRFCPHAGFCQEVIHGLDEWMVLFPIE